MKVVQLIMHSYANLLPDCSLLYHICMDLVKFYELLIKCILCFITFACQVHLG